MPHDKQHILLEEGGHPSLALLRQYHEDALPDKLSHQVEKHLLACELCADVVEGMALSDAPGTRAAVKEINQRIAASIEQDRKRTSLPAWQVAAAVLLLLCTSALVIYYNFNNLQQKGGNIAVEQKVSKSMAIPETPITRQETEDSVNEYTAQSIAAVAPAEKVSRKVKPLIVTPDAEVIEDVYSDKLVAEVAEEESKSVTLELQHDAVDTPALATTPTEGITESSDFTSAPLSLSIAPTNVPESTSVSNALQGKVAGVTIRGMSSLKKNDAAAKLISGQVLGEDGQPLPGVTVRLKGTTLGISTDESGKFIFPVTGAKPVLQFHFIGYESTEEAITANTDSVSIAMAPDNQALSEVVVVGYSTAKPGEAPAIIAAKPEGGRSAYKKYLRENLRVPAGSENERGKVVVGLTVAASGEIKNVQVLESLCPACDAEAVRLVKEGPSWKPATQAGTPREQQVKVTVKFRGKNR